MRPQLSICLFLRSNQLAESLTRLLVSERYAVSSFKSETEFLQFVGSKNQQIDCLILEDDPALVQLANQLRQDETLLPAVILRFTPAETNNGDLIVPSELMIGPATTQTLTSSAGEAYLTCFYHIAEVQISTDQLGKITDYIHQALTEFLNLSPHCDLTSRSKEDESSRATTAQHSLMQQQRRLAEKLRERLGYLGVYYKRNTKHFLRHLPPAQRQEFLEQLKSEYREIVLSYFADDNNLNQKIDNFVNLVFFADVPVTSIVEIHMELMDDFAKQLKLEGRSEEVLLDYRLTLIDTIAHLCEMYRRSIPQES